MCFVCLQVKSVVLSEELAASETKVFSNNRKCNKADSGHNVNAKLTVTKRGHGCSEAKSERGLQLLLYNPCCK